MNVHDILEDLLAEQQALDPIVEGLAPADWDRPTASPRWTVTDQIGHLTYFDHAAAFAIRSPERWDEQTSALWEAAATGDEGVDALTLGAVRSLAPEDRHRAWRAGRDDLEAAARTLDDDTRVLWYGPSMGGKSFLTARLMEVWAHGQDIVDVVGATRPATDRLRHVAQLGFITRGWTYVNRGLEAPKAEVHLELRSPSGATWTWGPPEAGDRVRGPAEDFCLVVTQRRNLADVELEVSGPAAQEWMAMAQAFAGPPTDAPAPGGFS